MEMRKATGILADTTELRKLILEHPDYPIAVIVSEDVNSGEYSWMYASDITFSTGEILDMQTPFCDEKVFNDKDDFEEELEEWLWDEMGGNDKDSRVSEAVFEDALKEEKAKYEPYWKECIIIYADN